MTRQVKVGAFVKGLFSDSVLDHDTVKVSWHR